MLKALLAIIHGLEVSFGNQSGGGLASAFQVLEIAHTHYWAKDISMTGFESQVIIHNLLFYVTWNDRLIISFKQMCMFLYISIKYYLNK